MYILGLALMPVMLLLALELSTSGASYQLRPECLLTIYIPNPAFGIHCSIECLQEDIRKSLWTWEWNRTV